MYVWQSLSRVWIFIVPWTDCSLPGSSVHGNSPVKNTGLGSHSLLQRIFPTQASNLGLLHCRWILYPWATREAHIAMELSSNYQLVLHMRVCSGFSILPHWFISQSTYPYYPTLITVAMLLLLLLLSRSSRVQLCATPWTAAHQAKNHQNNFKGVNFMVCM